MQRGIEHWREVSRNLDLALDLSPGECTRWLEELAAHSPNVAADVRLLLERRARPGFEKFLEDGAASVIKTIPLAGLAERAISGDVGESLLRMARSRLEQGDRVEARALLLQAVRCLRSAYGADHALTRQANVEWQAIDVV